MMYIEAHLGFPLHSNDDNHRQDDQRDGSSDADVVDTVVEDLDAVHLEKVVEGLTESDRVQRNSHGVGKGEDDADGRSEFRTQRTRYHVIRATFQRQIINMMKSSK